MRECLKLPLAARTEVETMKISLTPELERRIAEKVESGLYTTASEVVREGLRLLFSLDELREQRTERLRADIQVGLEFAGARRVDPNGRRFRGGNQAY